MLNKLIKWAKDTFYCGRCGKFNSIKDYTTHTC